MYIYCNPITDLHDYMVCQDNHILVYKSVVDTYILDLSQTTYDKMDLFLSCYFALYFWYNLYRSYRLYGLSSRKIATANSLVEFPWRAIYSDYTKVVCFLSWQVYSGSNDRNLLVWTPDHEVEARYMEYVEQQSARQSSNGAPNIPNTDISVLADTWSDDEDQHSLTIFLLLQRVLPLHTQSIFLIFNRTFEYSYLFCMYTL